MQTAHRTLKKVTYLALAVAALAASVLVAQAAAGVARRAKLDPKALLAVVVTDVDPAKVLKLGSSAKLPAMSAGPFTGHSTVNLYAVAIYNRRLTGSEGFDQETRFTLPDGGIYETRVTPVDPEGLPGGQTVRPDLGPHSVSVAAPLRMRRLARLAPAGTISNKDMRDATFTSVTLPVSGTWITGHNLYGTWTVDVSALQDGRPVSTARSTFVIRQND